MIMMAKTARKKVPRPPWRRAGKLSGCLASQGTKGGRSHRHGAGGPGDSDGACQRLRLPVAFLGPCGRAGCRQCPSWPWPAGASPPGEPGPPSREGGSRRRRPGGGPLAVAGHSLPLAAWVSARPPARHLRILVARPPPRATRPRSRTRTVGACQCVPVACSTCPSHRDLGIRPFPTFTL